MYITKSKISLARIVKFSTVYEKKYFQTVDVKYSIEATINGYYNAHKPPHSDLVKAVTDSV